MKVHYKDEVVSEYVADIIVERNIVLELKAQQQFSKAHEAQLLTYLEVTDSKTGMQVNFSYPRATIKRLVIQVNGMHGFKFFRVFPCASVAKN